MSATATATLELTVPGAPTEFTATVGDTKADLSWTLPVNVNEITNVEIRYQLASTLTWGAWVELGARATGHTVTGLVNGSSYTFEVRAKNSKGDGASASATATLALTVPGAPTGLDVTTGDQQADLSWTLPVNVNSITSVEVRHKLSSEQSWGAWVELAATATEHTVTNLVNGSTYQFEVRAFNTEGYGPAASKEATLALTVPGAPTEFTVETGDALADLTWKLPTNVNSITRVEVRHKLKSVSTWGRWVALTATTTTYTVVELENGSTYSFEVRAVNSVGNGPAAAAEATPTPGLVLIQESMEKTLPNTAVIIGGETAAGIRSRVQAYQMSPVSEGTGVNLTLDQRLAGSRWSEPIRLDASQFARSSQFTSLLNSFDGADKNGRGRRSLSVWSDAALNRFEDEGGPLQYEGEVSSFSFGLDKQVGQDKLSGVALSSFVGKTDYERGGTAGRQKLKVTSVNPYFGLKKPDYAIWSFVGVGSGDFELEQDNLAGTLTSDVLMNAMGFGASAQVWSTPRTTLNLTGDFTRTELNVEASGMIPEQEVGVNRSRLVVEARQQYLMRKGSLFEPSLEFGVAHDSGDGATSSRLEVGAGMHYLSPSRRISMSLSSYGLVQRNDYEEWGVQGSIRLQPNAKQRGLSFDLTPSYGTSVREIDRIWENERSNDGVADDDQYRPRLDAGLGFGFRFISDKALLTPYSEVSLEQDRGTYRVGTRFNYGGNFELNLVGERAESADDAADSIKLQGGIRF